MSKVTAQGPAGLPPEVLAMLCSPRTGQALRIEGEALVSIDGSERYKRRMQDLDLAGNSAREMATLPALTGLSRVHFIELELASADGKPISRNVY